MTAGRHRDPAAITGPLRIGRPSRQQLVDRPWDGPERRHLTRTDDRPATAWDQAAVPASVDDTGSFSLAELRAEWDPPSVPLRPWDSTGPLRILPAPQATRAPSLVGWWALAYALMAAAGVLLVLVLAPGGA